MPASDYRQVVQAFANRGLVQKLDPEFLGEGQYIDLRNATSIQEGSVSSRYGANRLFVNSPGSLIHTLEMFRISADEAEQFVYIGEGTEIYRVKLSQLLSGPGFAGTTMGAALDSSTWGKRWTAVKYDPGTARKAYFFIASLSKMLKDNAINADASLTTALKNWGIVPPPGAPTATLAASASKNVTPLAGSSLTWTTSPDESNTVKTLSLFASAVDFSQFDASTPSGSAANGFDNDDFVELVFTPKNPSRFDWFLLELDVSSVAGDYGDYYVKYIVPYQGSGALGKSTNPLTAITDRIALDDAGVTDNQTDSIAAVPDATQSDTFALNLGKLTETTRRSRPIELPPSRSEDTGTPQPITVRIRKNEFLKVGQAGTTGKTWANLNNIRLHARSLTVGSVDLTLTITSLKLVGGSGPYNSDGTKAPYRWAYCYRNDSTGHESNPCPLMVEPAWITNANRQGVALSNLVNTADTQVTSKAIYRAGGAFVDGFYRLVGFAGSVATTFTDTLSDNDIRDSKVLEFDNDPPVTSTLPTSMKATMAAVTATGSQPVVLTISQPSGVNADQFLTVGTRLQILDADKSEEIQITAVSVNTITAYFQNTHNSGKDVTASAIVNKACRLSVAAFDSVFLAGDSNNPHILYKSKTGRPESFPTIVEATGEANQQPVGSPSNPIMALTEFRGRVICLNLQNIYEVNVFNGVMRPPVETPAQRGLLTHFAWTKADNELYYLSHDGIYAWSGGQSVKKSEAIDWFFKGQNVGGIVPMDFAESNLQHAYMAYHKNEIHFICRDTGGATIYWRYHTLYDRWILNTPANEGTATAMTALLAYQQRLFSSRSITSGSTAAYVYEENTGTADNNTAIPFVCQTGFFTLGDPSVNKSFGDIVLELTSTQDLTVKTYYNFSGTADETLVITGASGRRRIPLSIQSGAAKEAYAIGFRFEGNSVAAGGITLHSITFNWLPLAQVQRGRAYDFSAWGYQHDKRLDQLIIEYDTGGNNVTFDLDVVHGINGSTQTNTVAQFILNSNGRAMATLPIRVKTSPPSGFTANDKIICKMARLRPSTSTSTDFKIWDYQITYEKYPPDITYFADPNDYGNPYDKYWQQFVIDVDTGGIAATCEIFIDDGTSGTPTKYQSLSINTNQTTRQQTFTLNPGIVGKKARLVITPGLNGKFQLFSHNFVTQPADLGPVVHTTDWDTLQWPYDKRLKSVTIEYDTKGVPNVQVKMDTLAGLSGTTINSAAKTFTLTGTGRGVQTFDLMDSSELLVKAIRLEPVSIPVTAFRMWKYTFDKDNYPTDITRKTDWDDLGYECEKILQSVTLTVDTGGIAATVELQKDGGTVVKSFTVNTTSANRVHIETLHSATEGLNIGKRFRFSVTPGGGGKFQLFKYDFNRLLEPCPLIRWDSYEQYFGTVGWRFMKQFWLEYVCAGQVTVSIYRDGNALFYQKTLPLHSFREVERFYVPAKNGAALNKSRAYRIVLEAVDTAKPFKMYRDNSRIELRELSGDIRNGYRSVYLWEMMGPQR